MMRLPVIYLLSCLLSCKPCADNLGVRRCGKSTLLKQMIRNSISDSFFINFDTPKLYNFDINDLKYWIKLFLKVIK
jgi:predicted AAA+ superfamily ATPase